ncbi:MAG: MipA/OmpV family protein, partial [Sneathiella sp.]|nr:MipA/OmpV family protein [Sneathiella sp.]
MINWKILSLTSVLSCVAVVSFASAEEKKKEGNWTLDLGLATAYMPEYEGSDDYKVAFKPEITLTWNDTLFISVDKGVGGYFFNEKNYKLGASILMTEGRDESDNDALRGLGDIDAGAGFSLFGSYKAGPVMFSGDLVQG